MFATGSLIMRSAGCVINDLWDQDFDRKVLIIVTRSFVDFRLSALAIDRSPLGPFTRLKHWCFCKRN
jgi:hypothetical protein